jgi:hypothetical protein
MLLLDPSGGDQQLPLLCSEAFETPTQCGSRRSASEMRRCQNPRAAACPARHYKGGLMARRFPLALVCALALALFVSTSTVQAQQAFGRQWGHSYSSRDWDRFYHYPYVYYPQNFWSAEYYRSSDDLYHRYPPEMRVPVYNKQWHNMYPEGQKYHWGHHFLLDTF